MIGIVKQLLDEKDKSSEIAEFYNFCKFANLRFDFLDIIKNAKINGERTARRPTGGIVFIFFTIIWGAYGCIKAGEQAARTLMSIVKTKLFTMHFKGSLICKACYETLRGYLRKFRLHSLREIHLQIIKMLEAYKAFVSTRFENLRIAAIDGTHVLNGIYVCVLALLGKKPFYYDFATYTKGMELPAAKRLLKEFAKSEIFTSINVFLMDALYFTEDIIKLLCSKGKKLVIKVKEKKQKEGYPPRRVFREVLKKAQYDIQRFDQGRELKYSKTIYVEEVYDKLRNREYKVYVVKGLSFAGVEVNIYFVIPLFNFIDKYKKVRADKFFVVTNINSAEKAVLLATERFQIEELYDITKNEFNIKYDFVYNNDFAAFRRLFTMIMIAINMMLWYIWCMSKRYKQKINLREFIRILRTGFYDFSKHLVYLLKPGRFKQESQQSFEIACLILGCENSGCILKPENFS